jgi:type IV fimbrial biogenesis protein FimT
MQNNPKIVQNRAGFTFIELLVVFIVLAALAAAAIPSFAVWMPNYRVKKAARDLYSDMQLAKLGAIKENVSWRIVFNPAIVPGTYAVWSHGPNNNWDGGAVDDVSVKTVNFNVYGSSVDYGSTAAQSATNPPGGLPGDNVSYNGNAAIFNPRGTNTNGYVYIVNNRGTSYVVGTPSVAGVIELKKWTGGSWQ